MPQFQRVCAAGRNIAEMNAIGVDMREATYSRSMVTVSGNRGLEVFDGISFIMVFARSLVCCTYPKQISPRPFADL
jgi:hypothetical protein